MKILLVLSVMLYAFEPGTLNLEPFLICLCGPVAIFKGAENKGDSP